MGKKYISEEIGDEYKEWNKGDIILIKSPTGTGKSEFIKGVLLNWCKEQNKSILLLSNRAILYKQQINDLKDKIGEGCNIDLALYQSVPIDIEGYDYVVCDECHYFFEDSSFNRNTDILYKKIKAYSKGIVILLSATPDIIESCLKDRIKDNTFDLPLVINKYSLYKYWSEKSVPRIIQQIREEHPNEKIIYFSSLENACNLSIAFDDTAFLCSRNSKQYKKYKKYVSELERERIQTQNHFDCNLLCTTTALDNGVNIKDEQVKHIILDVFTPASTVQCFGRKRLDENEHINIYLRDHKKKTINAHKTNIYREYVFYLDYIGLSHEDFALKHHKFESQRILDLCYDSEQGFYFEVNECIRDWDAFMISFCSDCFVLEDYFYRICSYLGINDNKAINIEEKAEQENVELVLKKWVGKKIFDADKKKFKEEVVASSELIGLDKKIGKIKINGLIRLLDLPYEIISNAEWSGENRNKRYWEVTEKCSENEDISI